MVDDTALGNWLPEESGEMGGEEKGERPRKKEEWDKEARFWKFSMQQRRWERKENGRREKKEKVFRMVGHNGDKKKTKSLKKKLKSWEQKKHTKFQKDGGLERTVQEG